jgi:hypothetical protein
MKSHLRTQDLWHYVNGTTPRPDLDKESTAGQYYERYLTVCKWREADEKAMAIICTAVSPAIRHDIGSKGISKSMWDTIKSKFNIGLPVPPLVGLHEADMTRYVSCRDVHDYIQRMSTAMDKLEGTLARGKRTPELVKIHYLLWNLRESWNVFRDVYVNCRYNKAIDTFDSVAQELILEDMRVKALYTSNPSRKARK